jgi:hypothetical protein
MMDLSSVLDRALTFMGCMAVLVADIATVMSESTAVSAGYGDESLHVQPHVMKAA